MVVSNILYFHPENWGRFSPNLTFAYFSDGWGKNHQPEIIPFPFLIGFLRGGGDSPNLP